MVTALLTSRHTSARDRENMAVQLSLKQQACYLQNVDDGDEPVDDADCRTEKIQTTAILFEFLETTAERDGSLAYRDRIRMRGEVSECIRLQMQQTTVNQVQTITK